MKNFCAKLVVFLFFSTRNACFFNPPTDPWRSRAEFASKRCAMEAATLSVAERVSLWNGAAEPSLSQPEQLACVSQAVKTGALAEDDTELLNQPVATAEASGSPLEQALQDKVQQQAEQLHHQATLLRDALHHGEQCEARLAATAASAAAAAATGTAGSETASGAFAPSGTSRASPKRRPPRPASGEATARREMRELGVSHIALLRKHAAAEERLHEAQATLRALRATHDATTKELVAAHARATRRVTAGCSGGGGGGSGSGAGLGVGVSAGAAMPTGAVSASAVSLPELGSGGSPLPGTTIESLRVERAQLQQGLLRAAEAAKTKVRAHEREGAGGT